jgi:hypothetical protein
MRLAALLLLVRYLGEASGHAGSLQRCGKAVGSIEASVAPVWRHRFEAHRAAFEHGLQPVDAAIALSQTLGPAEAVGRAVTHAELFEADVLLNSVVRGVDVGDVGVRLVWSGLARHRHDMDRDVCPAREGDDGLPAVANEAVGGRAAERHRDRGAIDIRKHGVDSHDLAVAGDEDGYVVEEETGMTGLAAARALLPGKIGSPALELLVCLVVLADGLPAVKAACAQAMLEGVRDQPA